MTFDPGALGAVVSGGVGTAAGLGSVVQRVDWLAIGPGVVLAVTAVVVLIGDLFVPATAQPARRVQLAVGGSLVGTLAALGWSVWLGVSGTRQTFCLPPTRLPAQVGGLEVGRSCSYVTDHYAVFFQVLVLAALAVVLLLLLASMTADGMPPGETCFLLLSAVTGMVVLAAARDLVTMVIALEVVSLPAFVLVGLRRSDPRSAQAAVTFFVVSVVSTALTVYGMALVYGVTGTLSLDRIAPALAAVRAGANGTAANGTAAHGTLPFAADERLAAAAVVLVVAGFAFKVAAVPFHAWAPDTYQGAPIPVAAMLSVASKAAGFAGLIVLLLEAFRPYASVWGPVVAVVAALTMTIGNLVALRQWHVVRLLAWSTVAQGGYLLVPLGVASTAAGRTPGSLHSAEQATLAYLGIYAAMNLGAFAVVTAVSAGTPRRAISDYRGLASRSPWLAAALALFLTALAGLPPGVAGLVAKVVVLRSAVDGHVTWLAVVAAVNTVVGLAYYLRLAALPFAGLGAGSDPTDDDRTASGQDATATGTTRGVPSRRRVPAPLVAATSLAALATVVLSVDPQPLLHAAGLAAG